MTQSSVNLPHILASKAMATQTRWGGLRKRLLPHRPSKDAKFTKFLDLPVELQLIIWEHALPDIMVISGMEPLIRMPTAITPPILEGVYTAIYKPKNFHQSGILPTAFHVCYRSREVALKYFLRLHNVDTSALDTQKPLYLVFLGQRLSLLIAEPKI